MQHTRRMFIGIIICFLFLISIVLASLNEFVYALTNENSSYSIEVLSGLEKQKIYYEKLKDNSTANNELEKIENLINATDDIINDYKNLNIDGRSSNSSDSSNVATMISYFSSKGYVLAAELLTHMRDNKDLNSIYSPVNGNRVVGTTAFDGIINSNLRSGSTAFSNDGTNLGADTYYSLNKCAFTKASSGKAIVLTDRYDYDTSGYSWSIQGVAVSMMYNAQQNGYLTPFYTVITQEIIPGSAKPIPQTTINITSSDSRNRFFEEVVTLGKGDIKEFNISYAIGGGKVLQTLGSKDTYLELYDSQGVLLASNDDDGYKNNALISYTFLANTNYILRVKFYSSSVLGDIKIVGTSADSVTKYENIYSMNSTPSGELYTFTGVNETTLYSFTPSVRNTFTLKLEGQNNGNVAAMYVYLLDPRSTVPIVSELNTSTTYSPSQYSFNPPATIVKDLSSGVPYLIIVASMNMSSQVLYNLSIK